MSHRPSNDAALRTVRRGVSSTLLAIALCACASPASADPMAEVGVSAGLVLRDEQSAAKKNPSGITYGPGFGQLVDAKIRLHRYLRFGVYYQRSYHEARIPMEVLGPAGTSYDLDSLLTFSLGARLEPTISLSDRFRVAAIIGAGWGRVTSQKMRVTTPDRSFTVYEREGVGVEIPMGLAASFDIIPDWLAITASMVIAPHLAQTGNLFENAQFVDSNGKMQYALSFPNFAPTFTQMIGLTLLR